MSEKGATQQVVQSPEELLQALRRKPTLQELRNKVKSQKSVNQANAQHSAKAAQKEADASGKPHALQAAEDEAQRAPPTKLAESGLIPSLNSGSFAAEEIAARAPKTACKEDSPKAVLLAQSLTNSTLQPALQGPGDGLGHRAAADVVDAASGRKHGYALQPARGVVHQRLDMRQR